MYLTRVRLNARRRTARDLLASPHRLHGAVLACYPDLVESEPDGSRVLWRTDRHDDTRVSLYIVSPQKPDAVHIVENAGWPDSAPAETLEYRKVLEQLEAGQRWAFRVTANPTYSVPSPIDSSESRRARGRRVGHVTVHQQEKWLLDKSGRHGFEIVRNDLDLPGGEGESEKARNLRLHDGQHRRFRRGNGKPATLRTVTYDGVLEVVDAEALRRALVAGIGPGKAYGCGLMTLARVNDS